VEAITPNQAITPYKPATFHKIDKDNNFAYPFEDIPHFLITSIYSRATLPKYELILRHNSNVDKMSPGRYYKPTAPTRYMRSANASTSVRRLTHTETR
jgi:hypothetical protein